MKEARDILAEALVDNRPAVHRWLTVGWKETQEEESGALADKFLAALSEKGWTLAPVEGLDVETVAGALWFEGLVDAPAPTDPKVMEAASSLLGAVEGLRRHRRALTTDTGRTE
jgi:hypothetical protein